MPDPIRQIIAIYWLCDYFCMLFSGSRGSNDMIMRKIWLVFRLLSCSILMIALCYYDVRSQASPNGWLRQLDISSKISITKLPMDLFPLSINNHSDILVQDRNFKKLAIFNHGKLLLVNVASFAACSLNDKRQVLVEDGIGSPTKIWYKGNLSVLKLPTGYSAHNPCIDNKGEILVSNDQDAFGYFKSGKLTLLFNGMSNFTVFPTYMNDKHQVIGVIQGPINSSSKPLKTPFTSRPFLLEGDKIRILKWPGTGFCYPTCINDNSQIVGEYRPEHGNPNSYAILWMKPSAPMLKMNALIAVPPSCQLSANKGCNNQLQIVGYGQRNEVHFSYLCSGLSSK